ncbi:MAG: UDP-N-acetylmuramoyl-tripeptide--D-alanyl-D-alanine ligase, partial [Candidatus Binatia bacterium]
LLGDRAELVRHGALAAGMSPERIIIGKDHTALAERLRTQVKKGDCLLFKGSRGMKMEKVLDGLKSGKA